MKIGFDNDIFCLQRYGGISRYYVELAKELQNLGNQTKVFAGLYVNEYLESISDQVVGMKISQSRKPKPIRKLIPKINHLVGKKLINCWQPDVIHQTYYSPYRSSKPAVVTTYDMIHELYASEMNPNDNTSHLKKIATQNADHIIAISQSTKNDLINIFNIEESKISVVYLGFLANSSITLSSCGNMHENITDKPYILYVGQRGVYKNFHNLLLAYSSNNFLRNNFQLVSFGGGQFSEEELSVLKKLGLNNTQVLNYQGDDNLLIQLYQNAQAFIYPSKYEGFGIPPLEAMAQNCPVVCSNSSSIPEVVGDSAILFSPDDIDEISSKIELIVTDSTLRETYINLGQKRLQYFSWEKCAKQTLDIYKSLL